MKTTDLENLEVKEVITGNVIIESNAMRVELDKEFPRVISYTWKEDNSILIGQDEKLVTVELNGELHIPVVTSLLENNKIKYALEFEELDTEINLEFKVFENVLRMDVTSIKENGEYRVKYINIPNHSLVSVTENNNGKMSSLWTTGDWNNIKEEFIGVKDAEYKGGNSLKRTYAFVNNDSFVATVNNNVIDGSARVILCVKPVYGEDTKKVELSNGTWTYREVVMDDSNKPYVGPEELPWSEVRIGKDINGDGVIDWQDGAILYRDSMIDTNTTPKFCEYIRDSLSYISFNIGSLVQSPFLRSLDMIKKVANCTDNFGQLIINKGYEAEGHDDSHADLGGHIGIRQGGKKDFNTLINAGKRYNAKMGVHINVTEYMLDSFSLDYNVLKQPLAKGWAWLDKSYYVDKKYDITSGGLYNRLNELKEDAPELSWVYVDVYTGNNWEGYKLYKKLNENGWMAATEFAGPMEQGVAFTHWGTDPAYPNQGNGSKIMRFIRNSFQDTFLKHPLVKGSQQLLVGGWGNEVNLEGSIEVFYNQVLPTKFLQYFPIIKMSDDRVDFEKGVYSIRENGKVNIYRGNDLVAITDDAELSNESTVFIPWNPETEEKIYHWNNQGGITTWNLPNSWANVERVYAYTLDSLGKTFAFEVQPIDGKVTIEANEKTPYLLLKKMINKEDEKPEMNWGEGGFIKDPGFDSQTLDFWNVKSTCGTIDHVSIEKETHSKRRGNEVLKVTGNNNAIISQVIEGLTPGKTYSASVWVKVTGNRKVTLGVNNFGGEEVTNYIDRPAWTRQGEGVKFLEDNFTRIKVDFTVADGNTIAELYLKVDNSQENVEVFADDFRVWENPNHTDRSGYVLYEDFENVDEGWGPFFLAVEGTSVRGHMVEKNPNGGQHMHFVLDGNFSFKTNQLPEEIGEVVKTEQSTLKLDANKTYEIGFLYTAMQDKIHAVKIKSSLSDNTPLYEAIRAGKRKTFVAQFNTGDSNDCYLSIDKVTGYDELVIDNLYIKEI